MNILILGAGRVGRLIAADLSFDNTFTITVADQSHTALQKLKKYPDLELRQSDLGNRKHLAKLVDSRDLVIDALPGQLGYKTFKTVIENGTHIVDLAFFAEDPFQLDHLAKKNGVTAVMDCGIAPGFSNLLVGHCNKELDELDVVRILVGGLPVKREWPYEYKAVFSPADVIEEYIRPARLIENYHLVTREALSEPEFIDFPEVGTLEAFNTDGLRTLIRTVKAKNMKEKTLRYPGHREKIAVLRETGFFDKSAVRINQTQIRPIDFTTRMLLNTWELKENEEDFTLLDVQVEGRKGKEKFRFSFHLFDTYDRENTFTSMARTTGFMASITCRLIVNGHFREKGVFAPEIIGENKDCLNFLIEGYKQRKVDYHSAVEKIN